MITILIVLALVAIAAAVISYMRTDQSEKRRHGAALDVEAEERQGIANEKLRRAEELATRAADRAAEAERLDAEAASEVEAARSEEQLSTEAKRRASSTRRSRGAARLLTKD